MEEQPVANIIQIRRDTAANWTTINPVLASGELGFETNTGKLKMGDASTNWAGLGYYTLGTAGFAALASAPTFTGTVTAPTVNASTALQIGGTAITSTAAELNYTDGVTSNIQTQLQSIINSKQAQPTLKGANFTMTSGEFIIATAGSITLTLPASPSAGDNVTVKDGTGAAATTNFTVARNSSKIASSATDLTFDKNFAEITMTYINATIGWSV
jgi:hypothetical protein